MNFHLAVNTVTIKPTPFMDKVKLISQVGFSGIGLWMDEIQECLRQSGPRSINELLEEYTLTPVEMQLLRRWQYLDRSEHKPAFDEARELFAKVHELGLRCPVVALPSEDIGAMRDAVRDFKTLCRLADDYGINIAFEFIGWAKQFNNIRTAWEMVDGADCPNAGLLVDTFHFVKGESMIEDLRQIPMEKVFLVHVNDMKPLNIGIKEQSRRFRFFPGEGEAPLKEIIQCFVERDYKGFYCCEIFNEDYWSQDPLSVLNKSRQSMESLLTSSTIR